MILKDGEIDIKLLETGRWQTWNSRCVSVNVILFQNVADTITYQKCSKPNVILYDIMEREQNKYENLCPIPSMKHSIKMFKPFQRIVCLILKSRFDVNIFRDQLWNFSLFFQEWLETKLGKHKASEIERTSLKTYEIHS